MNHKLSGILIILAAVSIMAAIVYIIFFSQNSADDLIDRIKQEPPADTVTPVPDDGGPDDGGAADPPRRVINVDDPGQAAGRAEADDPDTFGKDDMMRMAASFAERFGSYSNQSNYSNLLDLKLFMTRSMKDWTDDYIAGQRQAAKPTDIYYGITTKSIGTELIDYDDDVGTAQVKVSTRRREAASATDNVSNVFGQDIIIYLRMESGAWRIDKAAWQ